MRKIRTVSFVMMLIGVALVIDGKMIRAGTTTPTTPDKVEVVTPAYAPQPGNFEPRFGTYEYNVTWQGIPAGTLKLRLEQHGPDYRIRAGARTNRAIDIFYKLRFSTEALVSTDTLRPRTSVYDNRANNRREQTKIEFLPDGQIRSRHEDRRGRVKRLQFKPNNLTLDPFSAVFLALSLPWQVGDTRWFDIFTGKSSYLVELTAIDKTIIQVKETDREAIVVSPTVFKLTDEDSDDDDRLREVKIYVSTEPSREILRIESDVFVGTVNTRMISFIPSGNGGDDTPDI